MRLIDADALLQALEIEIHKKYPFSLKDLITNAPTVEPVAWLNKIQSITEKEYYETQLMAEYTDPNQ